MQKKLIALAIAGLSGAAFAQSNVTIYGAVDATYDNVKADSATNDAVTNPLGTTALNYQARGRTTMNSSYIGFKGTEALGNGLAVAWQVETGFGENAAGNTNTTGGTTYGWAGRDTYVGLAGSFGTIAAGTLTGPARAIGSGWDVNAGATGVGANSALLGKLAGGGGSSHADTRFSNAIAYISPNFNGFSGVLAYVPNENRGKDVNTSTTASTDTSAWTLGLNYANGPLSVAYAYTDIKDKDAKNTVQGSGLGVHTGLDWAAGTAFIEKYQDSRIAAKYDFGQGTIGVIYDETKATVDSVGGGSVFGAQLFGKDVKSKTWYIPVTFNVGSGKIIAQYGKAKADGDAYSALGLNDSDFGAKHYELGYEYSLSKRTVLKAVYSKIKNDKYATYDFGVGNVNGGTITGTTNTNVGAGSTVQAVSIGLRHNF